MADDILTQEYLHSIFIYKDGELYWRQRPSHNIKAGSIAGYTQTNGYKAVRVNKKMYKTHRIIFLMFYGWMPAQVDHKDTNPSNNQIENLRSVTLSENSYNAKKRVDNKSGVKGVYWHKESKKWSVQVTVNKERKFFGLFDDLELADLVAQEARTKYHGQYARHF
jgi:hypothetical protein